MNHITEDMWRSITPENITPENITPENITPKNITPEKINPDNIITENFTLRTFPLRTLPQITLPRRTLTQRTQVQRTRLQIKSRATDSVLGASFIPNLHKVVPSMVFQYRIYPKHHFPPFSFSQHQQQIEKISLILWGLVANNQLYQPMWRIEL